MLMFLSMGEVRKTTLMSPMSWDPHSYNYTAYNTEGQGI